MDEWDAGDVGGEESDEVRLSSSPFRRSKRILDVIETPCFPRMAIPLEMSLFDGRHHTRCGE